MSGSMSINLRNLSPQVQPFYVFQRPAGFSSTAAVYSASLFCAPLAPLNSSGAVLSVTLMQQAGSAYAGAQHQLASPEIGQISGGVTAMQEVTLSAPAQQPPNTTNLTTTPLGLSPAYYSKDPPAGAFRIVLPSFNPVLQPLNAGCAIANLDQSITLSSFLTASPLTNLDCTPAVIFYVQVGTYAPRTVIDFSAASQNAACCDFTPGYASYAVYYNADGTWRTTPYILAKSTDGRPILLPAERPAPG